MADPPARPTSVRPLPSRQRPRPRQRRLPRRLPLRAPRPGRRRPPARRRARAKPPLTPSPTLHPDTHPVSHLHADRPRARAAARPGDLRHRARRRRDDGEPLLRSLPRLAARRRRHAGGARRSPTSRANRSATFPLAPNFQNCQLEDPDHSYDGGRIQFNDGANDGWLRASTDDLFPIGYYTQEDLAFYGTAVPALDHLRPLLLRHPRARPSRIASTCTRRRPIA